MKSSLRIAALAALFSLATGAAQAQGRTCPNDTTGAPSGGISGFPPMSTMNQMIPADMAKIESALRAGQITPYQAGQLMRKQWENAQFQRGFLDAAPTNAKSDCGNAGAAGGCGGGSGGCLSGIDLAPLGDMAKTGLQTAGTVMKALKRETERLLRDEELNLPPL
jgi:hypothetical protein